MGMGGRNIPPLGAQGNVWDNQTTGAATNGNTVNLYDCPFVSAFGHVNGAATITLMLSADAQTWYAGPTVTTAGAGDFFLNATVGAQYATLQSSNSVTATATIQAKD